jgi:hypothetical protein
MTRLLTVLGVVMFALGSLLTFFLVPEPFGRAFVASLSLAVLGALLVLATAGLRLLRARRMWIRVSAVVPLSLAVLLTLVTAAVTIDVRTLFFRGLPPNPSAAEWQEDLDYLAAQMAARHPALFSLVPQERFDSVVAATRAAIPTLTEEQILMALFRVVALPNDAHTYPFIFDPVFDLHVFPMQAYWFDDGLYVVRAGRDYRRSVGSRVVAVAGVGIDDVYQGFRPFIAAENEYGRLDRWSGLPFAEWLVAEGLSTSSRAIVTLEHPDRGAYDITVRPVPLAAFGYWTYLRRVENTSSPAVSNDRRKAFRFEYDDDDRALYFDFNQSWSEWGGDTLATVLAELDAFLDTHPCDRFILDLRNNGGGDLRPALDVVRFISGDERIDQRGRLFVLIGRRTFSAGAVTASLMQETTSAILMGEPTGQGPVFFAGPAFITLPHSRLPVAISTRRTVSTLSEHPGDRIAPDVTVGYNHDDFFAGRDPLRAAALAYDASPIATGTPDIATLRRYIGRYGYSPHQVAELTLEGERLVLSVHDYIPSSSAWLRTMLHQTANAQFATEIPGLRVSFDRSAAGAAGARIEWDGMQREAPRLAENYRFPLELLQSGAIDDAVESLLANRAYYATAVPGLEAYVNRLGYDCLGDGRSEEAITLFQLNVALFPESSNTYDSLGEGYLERGDTALAVTNYRRSLDLNPGNDNARGMLRRMGVYE